MDQSPTCHLWPEDYPFIRGTPAEIPSRLCRFEQHFPQDYPDAKPSVDFR